MDSGQHNRGERGLKKLATTLCHAERSPEERLRRGRAQTDHGPWFHKRKLDIEPGPARRDVLRPRFLVDPPLPAWLPVEVLHHVGDVDIAAVNPGRLERAIEQLARRADEGPPDLIFQVAGLFADQHQPGAFRAFSKHGLRTLRPELARVALLGRLAD